MEGNGLQGLCFLPFMGKGQAVGDVEAIFFPLSGFLPACGESLVRGTSG